MQASQLEGQVIVDVQLVNSPDVIGLVPVTNLEGGVPSLDANLAPAGARVAEDLDAGQTATIDRRDSTTRLHAETPGFPKERIPIWNTLAQCRLGKRSCPMRKNLQRYLSLHPSYEVYADQDKAYEQLSDFSSKVDREVAQTIEGPGTGRGQLHGDTPVGESVEQREQLEIALPSWQSQRGQDDLSNQAVPERFLPSADDEQQHRAKLIGLEDEEEEWGSKTIPSPPTARKRRRLRRMSEIVSERGATGTDSPPCSGMALQENSAGGALELRNNTPEVSGLSLGWLYDAAAAASEAEVGVQRALEGDTGVHGVATGEKELDNQAAVLQPGAPDSDLKNASDTGVGSLPNLPCPQAKAVSEAEAGLLRIFINSPVHSNGSEEQQGEEGRCSSSSSSAVLRRNCGQFLSQGAGWVDKCGTNADDLAAPERGPPQDQSEPQSDLPGPEEGVQKASQLVGNFEFLGGTGVNDMEEQGRVQRGMEKRSGAGLVVDPHRISMERKLQDADETGDSDEVESPMGMSMSMQQSSGDRTVPRNGGCDAELGDFQRRESGEAQEGHMASAEPQISRPPSMQSLSDLAGGIGDGACMWAESDHAPGPAFDPDTGLLQQHHPVVATEEAFDDSTPPVPSADGMPGEVAACGGLSMAAFGNDGREVPGGDSTSGLFQLGGDGGLDARIQQGGEDALQTAHEPMAQMKLESFEALEGQRSSPSRADTTSQELQLQLRLQLQSPQTQQLPSAQHAFHSNDVNVGHDRDRGLITLAQPASLLDDSGHKSPDPPPLPDGSLPTSSAKPLASFIHLPHELVASSAGPGHSIGQETHPPPPEAHEEAEAPSGWVPRVWPGLFEDLAMGQSSGYRNPGLDLNVRQPQKIAPAQEKVPESRGPGFLAARSRMQVLNSPLGGIRGSLLQKESPKRFKIPSNHALVLREFATGVQWNAHGIENSKEAIDVCKKTRLEMRQLKKWISNHRPKETPSVSPDGPAGAAFVKKEPKSAASPKRDRGAMQKDLPLEPRAAQPTWPSEETAGTLLSAGLAGSNQGGLNSSSLDFWRMPDPPPLPAEWTRSGPMPKVPDSSGLEANLGGSFGGGDASRQSIRANAEAAADNQCSGQSGPSAFMAFRQEPGAGDQTGVGISQATEAGQPFMELGTSSKPGPSQESAGSGSIPGPSLAWVPSQQQAVAPLFQPAAGWPQLPFMRDPERGIYASPTPAAVDHLMTRRFAELQQEPYFTPMPPPPPGLGSYPGPHAQIPSPPAPSPFVPDRQQPEWVPPVSQGLSPWPMLPPSIPPNPQPFRENKALKPVRSDQNFRGADTSGGFVHPGYPPPIPGLQPSWDGPFEMGCINRTRTPGSVHREGGASNYHVWDPVPKRFTEEAAGTLVQATNVRALPPLHLPIPPAQSPLATTAFGSHSEPGPPWPHFSSQSYGPDLNAGGRAHIPDMSDSAAELRTGMHAALLRGPEAAQHYILELASQLGGGQAGMHQAIQILAPGLSYRLKLHPGLTSASSSSLEVQDQGPLAPPLPAIAPLSLPGPAAAARQTGFSSRPMQFQQHVQSSTIRPAEPTTLGQSPASKDGLWTGGYTGQPQSAHMPDQPPSRPPATEENSAPVASGSLAVTDSGLAIRPWEPGSPPFQPHPNFGHLNPPPPVLEPASGMPYGWTPHPVYFQDKPRPGPPPCTGTGPSPGQLSSMEGQPATPSRRRTASRSMTSALQRLRRQRSTGRSGPGVSSALQPKQLFAPSPGGDPTWDPLPPGPGSGRGAASGSGPDSGLGSGSQPHRVPAGGPVLARSGGPRESAAMLRAKRAASALRSRPLESRRRAGTPQKTTAGAGSSRDGTGFRGMGPKSGEQGVLFEKALTNSDTSHLGRIVLPKVPAEKYLPQVDEKEGILIVVEDSTGGQWCFRYRFWPNNKSRMYVLEHAAEYLQAFSLQPGDSLLFCRSVLGHLILKEKRASGGTFSPGLPARPLPASANHAAASAAGPDSLPHLIQERPSLSSEPNTNSSLFRLTFPERDDGSDVGGMAQQCGPGYEDPSGLTAGRSGPMVELALVTGRSSSAGGTGSGDDGHFQDVDSEAEPEGPSTPASVPRNSPTVSSPSRMTEFREARGLCREIAETETKSEIRLPLESGPQGSEGTGPDPLAGFNTGRGADTCQEGSYGGGNGGSHEVRYEVTIGSSHGVSHEGSHGGSHGVSYRGSHGGSHGGCSQREESLAEHGEEALEGRTTGPMPVPGSSPDPSCGPALDRAPTLSYDALPGPLPSSEPSADLFASLDMPASLVPPLAGSRVYAADQGIPPGTDADVKCHRWDRPFGT